MRFTEYQIQRLLAFLNKRKLDRQERALQAKLIADAKEFVAYDTAKRKNYEDK